MMSRETLAGALAVTACLAIASTAADAPAQPWEPSCEASTALGKHPDKHPHQLLFRVDCNFEVENVGLGVSASSVVRRVQRHPRLRGGESQDHLVCRRFKKYKRDAACSGSMGSEVTLVGALSVRGDRCKTATNFNVFGGMDCEDGGPGTACPAIGYFVNLRDPKPSGCA